MWYAKPTYGYVDSSIEAHANALSIAEIMYAAGWIKECVCAAIGNASQGESNLNPWRWENNYIPTYSEFLNWTAAQAQTHGYGLFQFTPANKYINSQNQSLYPSSYHPNFSDSTGQAIDGDAQVRYLTDTGIYTDWMAASYAYYYNAFMNVGVDITPWYDTTLANFFNGVDNNGNALTLAQLTGVFELCYERPGDTYAANSYAARVSSAEYWYNELPNPPTPSQYNKMPWIYYLKRRRF